MNVKRRILVCGDRNWIDRRLILNMLRNERDMIEAVIEGECTGADVIARKAADYLKIPVFAFPAEWDKHGRAAGPIRNTQMLREGKPDEIWAFHDRIRDSKGTKNMITQALAKGILVTLIHHEKGNLGPILSMQYTSSESFLKTVTG